MPDPKKKKPKADTSIFDSIFGKPDPGKVRGTAGSLGDPDRQRKKPKK